MKKLDILMEKLDQKPVIFDGDFGGRFPIFT